MQVTLETAEKLGINAEEFDKIKEILGREPNFTELSVFSVMWSEHCSYKNSIKWLKTLPKESDKMLAAAGEENAGLVDIGNGLACCFKIESHNHPSAIEPYQGAATGVGGINRDIFSMGARPIAQLNSLRFGKLSEDRTKWLMKGVVKGIGDYGNAFGIPTVGGEVTFEDCYHTNNLVNAMSAGIAQVGKTVSATAEGVGNPVYIFGAATGKDGIHGATFASEEITEESSEKLPSVQVGDPFWEKLLLEATMEIIETTDAVVGLQDMGAAGITCSTSEMSAKGKSGVRIDLNKVPKRQEDMLDWEILLSESQERMLIVIKKGHEAEVEKILDKWDVTWANIGEVTDTGDVEYYMNGELKAKIPAESLVLGGGAPVYEREYEEPAYTAKIKAFDMNAVSEPTHYKAVAEFLAALPNIASKRWVYNQYDSMVGTINQTTNRPADAGVVKIKGSDKSLALTVDCNPRFVYADPHNGTAMAVAEAARNIVCSGGEPVAITNCLNFGNPYDKGVYWQFVGAINGMREACLKFGTPVTGGNVSFYNQSHSGIAVYPTPTIGMVGLIDNNRPHMTLDFKSPDDVIYLIGKTQNDLGSSQYLAHYHKVEFSPAPYFNLDEEYNMQQAVKAVIAKDLVNSAHDISEGGLFIALLESAMVNNLGFDVAIDESIRKDAYLFGESQSRVAVSVSAENVAAFEAEMQAKGVHFQIVGAVTAGSIAVGGDDYGDVTDFKDLYDNAIEKALMSVPETLS